MRLGQPVAGDARTSATWDLVTDRGRATMRLAMDEVSGEVMAAELLAAARTMPPEAW
jgi:hypothetical protein